MTLLEDKEYLFSRPAFLMVAEIGFTVPRTFKELVPLCEAVGFNMPTPNSLTAFGLSEMGSPYGVYLRVIVTAVPGKVEKSRWRLRLERKPDSAPPSFMRESSDGVGGYAGLMTRLANMEVFGDPIEVQADGAYVLFEPKKWKLPVKRRHLAKKLKGLKFSEEKITFEASSSHTALRRLTFDFEDTLVTIRGLSRLELRVDAKLFDDMSEKVWSRIEQFLT